MKPIQRMFKPLRKVWQMLFARHVQLQRGKKGVEIILTERSKPADPRKEQARVHEQRELSLMRQQLADVLDDLPGTRQTLRHLVFVEQALVRNGWRALHKLPLDVLRRAHEQLEGLVTNWSPAGLANLRSKMAVAIIDREHMDPSAVADAHRTAMPLETTMPMGQAGRRGLAGQPGLPGLPAAAVLGETLLPDAGGDEAAALAAAYAALGVLPTAVAGSAAGAVAPNPAPTPAQLAAQTLAQMKISPAGGDGRAEEPGGIGPADEPLEYHHELGSRAARSQLRDRGLGHGKLPPLTLRQLQE
jgi:hypothetical protein